VEHSARWMQMFLDRRKKLSAEDTFKKVSAISLTLSIFAVEWAVHRRYD